MKNIKEELEKLRTIVVDGIKPEIENKKELKKTKENDEFIKLMEQMPYFTEQRVTPASKKLANYFTERLSKSNDLDDKINGFLIWYGENMAKGHYTTYKKEQVRNFIEKMAIWYELRYSNWEIDKIIQPEKDVVVNIDEEAFVNNKALRDIKNNSDTRDKWTNISKNLKYSDFNNYEFFLASLSATEKFYLRDIVYNSHVNLYIPTYKNILFDSTKIFLNPDGTINDIDENCIYPLNKEEYILKEDVIGKCLEDFAKLLEEKYNCSKEQLKDIKKEIKEMNNYRVFKEGLLNCVMYRLIERGGNIYGARRAFIFAKEFNRNIDIPMRYGACLYYPGIKEFVNMYLESGGNDDLICFTNYDMREHKIDPLGTIKVKRILELK